MFFYCLCEQYAHLKEHYDVRDLLGAPGTVCDILGS